MNLTPLITAGLETSLNRILYCDRGPKAARQRLNGKGWTLRLSAFSHPLVLGFC